MNEILEMFSLTPSFFYYFFLGMFFLAIYFYVYTLVTKFDEMVLIRHGNMAAAYALVGSALGFSFPVHAAIVHTTSIQDFAFWALVAMVAQVCTYLFLKLVLKDMDEQIEANNAAFGLLEGGISLVVGIINAACVT